MFDRNAKPGILVLADGASFEGYLFGAEVSADSIRKTKLRDRGYGEVVFNTSLTGYQEILTDPSYYGQIICMTNPHIGNTGVNPEDPESSHPWCAGFIVHEPSASPSNWRSKGGLNEYLITHGIPGLWGVDTRALTLHLRSMGVARGVILPFAEKDKALELISSLPDFEGRDMIGEVTTKEAYKWTKDLQQTKYKVVAMDFGAKWNLFRSLTQLGCSVEVVPANTTAADILARKPDGIFLSNGPGDPAAAPYAAKTVADLVGKVPLFGVCMGHQILALAMGGKTYKLKFGHRGANQPVLDKTTGKVEISSQNHGYAVDGSSLPNGIEVTHINLNDKTIAGIAIPKSKAFSVQYHPEACPGPHDSQELFERFVNLMEKNH